MAESRKTLPNTIIIKDANVSGNLEVRANQVVIMSNVNTHGDLNVSVTPAKYIQRHSLFRPSSDSCLVLHRPYGQQGSCKWMEAYHDNNDPVVYFNRLLEKEEGVKEMFSYFYPNYQPWIEHKLSDFHDHFASNHYYHYLLEINLPKGRVKKTCEDMQQEKLLPHVRILVKKTYGFYESQVEFDGTKFHRPHITSLSQPDF